MWPSLQYGRKGNSNNNPQKYGIIAHLYEFRQNPKIVDVRIKQSIK